jgi:hypothetical protein
MVRLDRPLEEPWLEGEMEESRALPETRADPLHIGWTQPGIPDPTPAAPCDHLGLKG